MGETEPDIPASSSVASAVSESLWLSARPVQISCCRTASAMGITMAVVDVLLSHMDRNTVQHMKPSTSLEQETGTVFLKFYLRLYQYKLQCFGLRTFFWQTSLSSIHEQIWKCVFVRLCVCVGVLLTFQAWPPRSSPCAGRCVCGGSTSLWRRPGRWLPSAAGWCLYNTLLPPEHKNICNVWGKKQGRGTSAVPSFTHFPTSPSSVWINTYSLPFVLFNLLYFPPAGFAASRRCISTRLLTSHPKPAALPLDGLFYSPFLSFPHTEQSTSRNKLHRMRGNNLKSFFFFTMTLKSSLFSKRTAFFPTLMTLRSAPKRCNKQ